MWGGGERGGEGGTAERDCRLASQSHIHLRNFNYYLCTARFIVKLETNNPGPSKINQVSHNSDMMGKVMTVFPEGGGTQGSVSRDKVGGSETSWRR